MSEPNLDRAVVLAVCTFDRPALVAALVERAAGLAAAETPDRPFRVVVVDDHPSGNAREACTDVATQRGLELTYLHVGSRNISVARTTALEAAMALGEFVVCVDDDCLPEPGWLGALVAMAEDRAADIVLGHHEFYAPEGAPRWLASEPFLVDHGLYPDGSVPLSGNMANMLMRSAWLRASGVRFRQHMGVSGGEDMVFFDDARASGASIRFAAASLVREAYSGSRSTLRYQLWRQTWLGNNEAHINRTVRAYPTSRLVLRGGRRVVRGLLHPLARLVRGRSSQWRWALATVGSGLGLLAGVAGIKVAHRT